MRGSTGRASRDGVESTLDEPRSEARARAAAALLDVCRRTSPEASRDIRTTLRIWRGRGLLDDLPEDVLTEIDALLLDA